MQLQGRDLKLDMRGADVRLLQFELTLLDLHISEEEVLENHFGEATQKAVVTFQSGVDLEESGVVDRRAARHINASIREKVPAEAALEQLVAAVKETLARIDKLEPGADDLRPHIERFTDTLRALAMALEDLRRRDAPDDLVADGEEMLRGGHEQLEALRASLDDDGDGEPVPFVVRGRVTQRDGAPVAAARVRAMLRAATTSRPLGIADSDGEGAYEIGYRLRSDRLPDLVVELLDRDGQQVLTRSPLIVEAAPDQIVDLVVDNAAYPPASEFDQLEAGLAPLLDGGHLEDVDADAVSYLAAKTGISPVRISEYVQARRYAQSGQVPAQVYYGLFRANLPVNRPALVAQDDAVLRRAVTVAAEANVIDAQGVGGDEAVERAIATLNSELVDTIVDQPQLSDGTASLGAFLDIAALDDGQKHAVVRHAQKHGRRGADFWKTLVAEEDMEPRAVRSMQLTAQLGTLTLNNAPLMRALQGRLQDDLDDENAEPLRALVGMTADNWADLVREQHDEDGNVIIPKNFRDREQPVEVYARTLTRMMEDAYPTPALASRLAPDAFEGADLLADFVTEHPDFEFRNRSVPAYLRTQDIELPAESRQVLENVSRLFDLAPRFERHETLQPLLAGGVQSAYQIRTMGQERFLADFGEALGQERAQQIYATAAQKTATTANLFTQHAAAFNNLHLSVIPEADIAGILDNLNLADPSVEIIDFPTWESLFGSIDFCDCKHCNSVYSPAAYLVALLKFLRDRGTLAAFLARRPDIGNVELTCHNTHTTLPYVDLVLEVLETFLVEGDETYQTEGEAAALRVHPEHINAEAYRILEEDLVYPWLLPFSLWAEEARAYLQPLNVTRQAIMDRFNAIVAEDRNVAAWLPLATEHLGLTSRMRALLLDGAFRTARWNGHTTPQLRTVQTLLDTAGLSFLELRQLLGTRFVNGDGALEIDFTVGQGDDAEFSCDLEQARIEALAPGHLNRIGRFMRLQRVLGWQIHELDTVLQALGGDLNAATLVALSFVKMLRERLDLSLPVIASWVADLDTHEYLNDDDEMARSLYASLFLNRTVGGDEELAPFELDALGGESIDDHEAAILAALQIITAEELALIRERRLQNNTLDLANLSELHRVATLKRALKLSVEDLLDLLHLSGMNPFTPARLHEALHLLDLQEILDILDFTAPELVYLLRHVYEANSRFALTETEIARFLEDLRDGLQRIRVDFAAVPDPGGEITAQMLGILLSEEDLAPTVSLLYGIVADDALPADPPTFLEAQLALFIPDAAARATTVARLLDEGHADYLQPELQQAERFALVLEPLAAHLRRLNSVTLVQQMFADFLDIELDASGQLLGELMRSVADATRPAGDLFLDAAFIDSDGEITAAAFADPFAMVYRLHKVTLLIIRFDLPAEELGWIVQAHATAGWLNLNTLPVAEVDDAGPRWAQWLRMARAAILRQEWPSGEPTLFALLRQAEDGGDAVAFDAFLVALTDRTGWNRADVGTLLDGAHFDVGDFDADWGGPDTLQHLWRMHACFVLLRRLGVSAAMAWGWAQGSAERDITRDLAGEVKQAARAKYSESQWLNVAEPIRDGLRSRQRDALVGAVLQKLDDPQIKDSNDLYAHFLMDAEMNPCMLTSRIVFSTGAVQLFVQRILLNLEEGIRFSNDDAAMWQWMKNYRVWEANVKVFITPENWIEPELRPEKSPFFVELENELLQNDVTLETAELAYQNYLERLDEVARLEVVGLYNENDTETLHVIARTRGTPRKYFYRQWYEARRWTPWQEVPVDIEGHAVTPVIYNRRLYIFWFSTMENAEEETQDEQKPNRYLEIKLAWSQFRQRKWSPKRISNVAVYTTKTRDDKESILDAASYRPRPIIRPDGDLDLFVAIERSSSDGGSSYLDSNKLSGSSGFLFISDGQVDLSTYNAPREETVINLPVQSARSWSYYFSGYGSAGMNVRGYDGSWQEVLDRAPFTYRVTVPLQYTSYNSFAPLFFEDRQRTYFITPRHIWGPAPSYGGDLTVEFPSWNVYLEEDIPVPIDDILEPVVPGGDIDPLPFRPSLESVLYPETRTPEVGIAISDTIASIDRHVLTQPTLTVVQGGARVTGGDVGIPIVGASGPTLARTQFTGMPAARANAPGTAMAAENMLRSDTIMRSANELVVANAVMNMGVATGIWGTWFNLYRRSEYTFYAFHHPYVGVLIKQLNRYGVDGILNPREHGEAHDLRRQLMKEPANEEFDDIYELGEDINDDLLPVEEFDFEYGRAYSIYNWELFFHIPFMIANHLSQNRRFDEARQWYNYIFDPTDNSDLPASQNRYRFWKIKPFFENTDIQTIEQLMRLLSSNDPADLEMKRRLEDQIKDWRENPFQPHLIAEQRPVAYQKAVVMKYMDNEIAQGDYLFRQDTMESVFEAIQHYILVAEMLGKRPEPVPAPEATPTIDGNPVRTFNDLAPHLDAFGNALVQLEAVLLSGSTSGDGASAAPGDLAAPGANGGGGAGGIDDLAAEAPVHEIVGSSLFFCIPQNEKLLGYWDIVEDRLFKIRNCMNIEGVVRQLDLFAPPIDPALLVRAAAAGLDLGSVLNDLNAPRPHYRFSIMVQKALELCDDVKALGSALLAALEKRDAEELALLRQTHEQNLLEAIKDVRERQVDEAQEALAGLQKNLESAEASHDFYASRNPLIPNEQLHLTRSEAANLFDNIAQGYALVGSALALIPEFDLGAEGGFSSPVVKAQFGGANLSRVLTFYSQLYSFLGSLERQGAQRALTLAGYERRQEEWDFSAEKARIDAEGLERQVAAAEIRIAIAEKDLENQELQIEQSREVDEFMRYKFTNRDLYSWMVTQISALYFQSYQLAYDVAKRAEKAFQHELADFSATFINFGYWDSLKKGLLAGERLERELRRMESAYYERNRRELELTKHVSLLRVDPAALVQLRETGSCEVEIPEALFSLDFPGHYLRRLKTVSLTIPAVVGPYTGLNATLTLLSNRIRTSTVDPHVPYQGLDDARFIVNVGGIQAIAASSGREDSGLFELNLRDERYLPFEGAGAIGRWRIELNEAYRPFDYDTISDVILHLRYTARDGGVAVRQQVVPALAERIDALVNATEHDGLYHFASLAHEYGNELHRFLQPAGAEDHRTTLALGRDRFPYIFQGRPINVQRVYLLLKMRDPALYDDGQPLAVELTRAEGDPESGDLASAGDLAGGLPLAEYIEIAGEIAQEEAWQLHVTPEAVQALPAELQHTVEIDGENVSRLRAEQFEDVALLLHYRIS